MSTVAVIPARMAATRFPDKPLADLHGLPMLMHCYFRTRLAQQVDEVVIATCDDVIAETARRYGARVVMTADTHLNAVDRTAEAVALLTADATARIDVVVLVQGDEPLLDPRTLDLLIETLTADPGIDVVNIMVPFTTREDFLDHNNPKVVTDARGDAVYMSREPIPSPWKQWDAGNSYMQTGLFAFRPDALAWFAATPRTDLEAAESIDMLRLVYHGRPLRMLAVPEPSIGVDTPDDLRRAADLLLTDPYFPSYQDQV